jgi:cellulose 1,4-beta-cellobiosidase
MSVMKFVVAAAALGGGALAEKCRPVASYEDSPFEGVQLRPDPYYVDEIETLAIPQLPADLVPAAKELAKVPTFQWLSVPIARKLVQPSRLTSNQ